MSTPHYTNSPLFSLIWGPPLPLVNVIFEWLLTWNKKYSHFYKRKNYFQQTRTTWKTEGPETLLKDNKTKCFLVTFAKFLGTLFLQKTTGGCFWNSKTISSLWLHKSKKGSFISCKSHITAFGLRFLNMTPSQLKQLPVQSNNRNSRKRCYKYVQS